MPASKTVQRVENLPPGAEETPRLCAAGRDRVEASEGACARFLARATQLRPSFAPADLKTIDRIVLHLGGMEEPLDHVAGWATAMGGPQILSRLADTPAVELAPKLFCSLSTADKALLDELGAFVGSFAVSDAEAVARSSEFGERLARLRTRGVLGCLTDHQGLRFLLPPWLRTEPNLDLAIRHGRWATELARRLSGRSTHVHTVERGVLALRPELVAAHRRLRSADPALALDPLLALRPVLAIAGTAKLLVEAIDEPLLGSVDAPREAQGRCMRGAALSELGRIWDAEEELLRARSIARSKGLREDEAKIANNLGLVTSRRGATDVALTHYESALALEPSAVLLGRVHLNMGLAQLSLGRAAAAETSYARALAIHRSTGNRRSEAIVLSARGNLWTRQGDPDRAIGCLVRARAILEEVGDERHEALSAVLQALACQQLGRLDEAAEHARLACLRHHAVGRVADEASARCVLADIARELGSVEEAHDSYAVALELARDVGDRWCEAIVACGLAATHARAERSEAARRVLARAEELGKTLGDPALDATIALSAAEIALRLDGDPGAENVYQRCAAEARVNDRPAFLRLAFRSLADALLQYEERLTVGPEGTWFRMGQGNRVNLSRKALLRRLLVHLVAVHRERPGTPVTRDELLRIGWPDEDARPSSMRNRLYVAVANLRKLGLGDRLVGDRGGYLIAPQVRVQHLV